MVYQDDNRCYYRLPGYPGLTYADPNRSTTRIFAYASFISGGQVVNAAAVPMAMEEYENGDVGLWEDAVPEMPYELEIIAPTVKEEVITAQNNDVANILIKDEATGAYIRSYGEASTDCVDDELLRQENLDFVNMAFGDGLRHDAIVTDLVDVMMEITDDGSPGEQTVIGHTTQFYNHFNGVRLDQNCIVVSSDANGINAVTNQWVDVAPVEGTMRIAQENAIESADT